MSKNKMQFKYTLNILVSAFLAAAPFLIYYYGHTNIGDDELFVESVFFWYLGVIFLLSARYAKRLFIFGLIDYVFDKSSVIGGKYRARIYGAISCVVGTFELYRWLTFG